MKISKSLSGKINKDSGMSEILLRIVVGKIDGKSVAFRVKSRIYVYPDRWDDMKETITTDVRSSKIAPVEVLLSKERLKNQLIETNTRLSQLLNVILLECNKMDKSDITKQFVETIIDKFHNPEKYSNRSFGEARLVTLVHKYIESNSTLSLLRKRHYMVIERILSRYELYKGIILDINTMTDIDLKNIEQFIREEHFLYKENESYRILFHKVPNSKSPMPRGQNVICTMFKQIRAVCRWAKIQGYTDNYPFEKYSIVSEKYGTPIYLTLEERNRLFRAEFPNRPQLAKQRDIFIFQCCVGCRVGDLLSLTCDNIVETNNGKNIEYVPSKTSHTNPETVSVPLNAIALEILNRYSGQNGNKILPFISDVKYNVAIKDAFRLAGLDRLVSVLNPITGKTEQKPLYDVASSHMARRTFVGNLYKKFKDPNLVGKLSGHKEGSRAFMRYRDIDQEMKVEMVKAIE